MRFEKLRSFIIVAVSAIFVISAAMGLRVMSAVAQEDSDVSDNKTVAYRYADENGVFLINMKNGASIRIGGKADGTESGIRFTAEINAADKEELDGKYGAENVTYGILIAKLADAKTGGELNGENVFGDKAKYNWAKDGKYEAESGKIRITNLTTKSQNLSKIGDKYEIRGSIVGIKDANLTVKRVARAYVKCATELGVEYYFSDYDLAKSRAVAEVADAAVSDGAALSEADKAWVRENYINRAMKGKMEAFEKAVESGDEAEIERLYGDLISYANSLRAENYALSVSETEVQSVNAKIEGIYRQKSDAKELVKTNVTETLVKITNNGKDANGLYVCDGFCVTNAYRFIVKNAANISGGLSVYTNSDSADPINLTLSFPLIKYGDYDCTKFSIYFDGMQSAEVNGGKLNIGMVNEVEIKSSGSKLTVYSSGNKISEITNSEIICGEQPLEISLNSCLQNGKTEVGAVIGEKFEYETTTEVMKYAKNSEIIEIDGTTVVSNSGIYTIPSASIVNNNNKLTVKHNSGENIGLYFPKNDYRVVRDLSFTLEFNNGNMTIGGANLASGVCHDVKLSYDGLKIAVNVGGKKVGEIFDDEILKGNKAVFANIANAMSGVEIKIGAMSKTTYKREAYFDNLIFDESLATREVVNGEEVTYKQGVYVKDGEITYANHKTLGSCLQIGLNSANSVLHLPTVDFTQNENVKFKLIITGGATASINGSYFMFGNETATISLSYDSGSGKLKATIVSESGTKNITLTDKSVIYGESGLTVELGNASGETAYVGCFDFAGVKSYAKLREIKAA